MHPLRLHVEQHLLAVHGVAHPVQAPQAGVLVARVERLERVADVALGGGVSQGRSVRSTGTLKSLRQTFFVFNLFHSGIKI